MFYKLVIWLTLYSIAGWVYETMICSVEQRRFVKRGFLNGPYCPIYGVGAILNIIVVGWIQNPVMFFFAGAVFACLLEYLTAWLLEVLFHAKWWDYSMKKYNIKGRVCLLGAAIFGLLSVFVIQLGHPFIVRQTDGMSEAAQMQIAIALLVVLIFDTAVSVTQLSAFNEKLKELQRIISNTFAGPQVYFERAKGTVVYTRLNDTLKEIMSKLTRQERRILIAFPHFKSTRYNDAVNKIREYLKNSRNKSN